MFIDKPIFGVGTNLFRYKCKEEKYLIKKHSGKKVNSCSTHPHNYYFQILAENGLVGISFLIFYYFFIIFIFFKNFFDLFYKKNSKKIIQNKIMICGLLLVICLPIIPHMGFYNNWYNVILMMPLGFFLRDLHN
jgi:O-antigen ligase